ncbi:MAG: hypothetical protein AAGD25_10720 [Cyanobacteria bacterium P01_F01_bin.150]
MSEIVQFHSVDKARQVLEKWQHRGFAVTCKYQLEVILFIVLASFYVCIPASWATSEVCDDFTFEASVLNTLPERAEGEVTIIGHLPNHNYVVVVPGRRESLLMEVRHYIPDAFVIESRLGTYVHAGAFETREDAEDLSMRLMACKIRSRVVYFRNGGSV